MRIAVAHSFYRLAGGEDRYVERQMALLASRHEVALLSERNTEARANVRTAARMTMSGAQRRRFERDIGTFAPDIVHLHNPYPLIGPAAHLAAERAAVPLVWTVHNYRMRCPNGLLFTEGSPCNRCERGNYAHAVFHDCFPSRVQSAAYAGSLWIHRFVLKLESKVTTFIAPSEFTYRRLLEWGVPAERVAMVRNFAEIPAGVSTRPGSFGVYLGRLSPEKGLDVLIGALRSCGDPPFRFVGDGPLARHLQHRARLLGLVNTTFDGLVDSETAGRLLREARFVVFPSLWDENAPLAALEALAAGRPIVATATGGLPELASDGRGELCPPGDEDALARCIRLLMENPGRCQDAGSRALEFAGVELAPNVHLSRLEGVYERARRAGAAPGQAQR